MNTETACPAPSLIHPLASLVEPLDMARLFPRAQPLEVELGSGDGSFLAQYAALHPQRNFLGVERLLGRLRKLDRKGARLGLSNLRCVRIEASYLLEYLLPPATIQALHIYFPDPWPKRKHHKHRLINDRFPLLAARVLAAAGVVYLRTDDAGYFARMHAVFAACASSFVQVPAPAELAAVQTDFERGFLQRGIPPLRLTFQWTGPLTHR